MLPHESALSPTLTTFAEGVSSTALISPALLARETSTSERSPLMHRLLYTATAVLVLVAAVSVITHSANGVIGTTTTAPARGYYLTKGTFHGNQALTACATGYHFASFSELNNPSFLTYNKT